MPLPISQSVLLSVSILLLIPSCQKQTPAPSTPQAPTGMAYIPAGSYIQGNEETDASWIEDYPEEYPAHPVTIKAFFIDQTEVTNAQFAAFVKATGYITSAEKGLSAKDFPDAAPADLVGGANVFKGSKKHLNPHSSSPWRWWVFTPGANWRHPEGPDSEITERMDHPVACVTYDDAKAYAAWAGKRLPTEAEWEYAAHAGSQATYIWGDEMKPNGRWLANVHQGDFPHTSETQDGFPLSAPVKSFPPNAYGLYDMAGNVWEICSDFYHPNTYRTLKGTQHNPTGPPSPISDIERAQFRPDLGVSTCPPLKEGSHPSTYLYVIKGGSFLCNPKYCHRFRPSARHYHETITPSQHIGFRCAKDIP